MVWNYDVQIGDKQPGMPTQLTTFSPFCFKEYNFITSANQFYPIT